MATVVLTTRTFEAWFAEQTEQTQNQIAVVIGLLAEKGVMLGAPYSSAIKGSKIALRELRPASGTSPARVFYAFDPERSAVVLCGASKTDAGDMYLAATRKAEREFAGHVAALKAKQAATAAAKKPKKKSKK